MVDDGAGQGLCVARDAGDRIEAIQGGASPAEFPRSDGPYQAGRDDRRSHGIGRSLPHRGKGLVSFGVGERLPPVLAGDVEPPRGKRTSAEAAAETVVFLADSVAVNLFRTGFHGARVNQVADSVLARLEQKSSGQKLGRGGGEVEIVVALFFPVGGLEPAQRRRGFGSGGLDEVVRQVELHHAVGVVEDFGFLTGRGVRVARCRVYVAGAINRRAGRRPYGSARTGGRRRLVLPKG